MMKKGKLSNFYSIMDFRNVFYALNKIIKLNNIYFAYLIFCTQQGRYFYLRAISIRWFVVPCPEIVINFPRTYENYIVKENHIGSAVSEIIRYKQIDR